MVSQRVEASGTVQLSLEGDWRIGRIATYRDKLHEVLQQKPAIIAADASAMTHLDTLGLQLLAVFAQQCQRQAVELRWSAVPTLLSEAAARLGLGAILALPATQPA